SRRRRARRPRRWTSTTSPRSGGRCPSTTSSPKAPSPRASRRTATSSCCWTTRANSLNRVSGARQESAVVPGIRGQLPVFCSWSGGKDSALALHRAVAAGAEPRFLVSMLTEGGERSRSHGLRRELLQAQAEAVGVPIRFGAATWSGYRDEFVRVVGEGVAE